MKYPLLFSTALFLSFSMTASATPAALEKPAEQCSTKTYHLYFGKVGELVYKALKKAGVKPVCDTRGCSLMISNFHSYVETDSCGGGTTGYGTSFQYADGTKYDVTFCEGGDGSDKPVENIGDGLVEVFVDLDLQETAGWVSSVNLAKVECVTNSKKGSEEGTFANCKVIPEVNQK